MEYELKHINQLGDIETLKKTAKAFALLDAILMPEWEYRYFSFNANWDGEKQEMMASMRDGEGAEYFIHFTNQGAAGKVLCDSALADTKQYLSLIPDVFLSFKTENAFKLANASFFFWKDKNDSEWAVTPQLNTYPLLGFLTGGAKAYHLWAEAYYEQDIDFATLNDVFSSLSISSKQLEILNPDIQLDDLTQDIQEIL